MLRVMDAANLSVDLEVSEGKNGRWRYHARLPNNDVVGGRPYGFDTKIEADAAGRFALGNAWRFKGDPIDLPKSNSKCIAAWIVSLVVAFVAGMAFCHWVL